MPRDPRRTGTELFIVDNSDRDWKVANYLHDWCQLSRAIDIATGYFEIGSLLALGEEWQKVDHLRILMGDEVSRRTKRAFDEGLQQANGRLDASLESEKEKNDFLTGVPAIAEAIRSGKITCRVYRRDKFHAKAYITHARQDVVGSFALVGSSNFTFPGLTENVELNVQQTGSPVKALQEWYEAHWNRAEDVTPDILRTIERHIREYLPFDVYAKALHEFFRGHARTAEDWEEAGRENGGSWMYRVLDGYQRQGYHDLMHIARQYGGAFLCDGVGLGKTFVGLMLIERLVMHDRKRVALFVPKSARADVWERDLRRYLPYLGGARGGDFSNLVIFNHTDLGRGGDFPHRFERIGKLADVIVIDEAHHFRNPGLQEKEARRPSRYWQLSHLIDGPGGPKQVFMLTATPINNRLDDFRHMVELFSRGQEAYFASTLGIHSLRGHFNTMKRQLDLVTAQRGQEDEATETNLAEAEKVLVEDSLFRALVEQRSRAYVKESQLQEGAKPAMFPSREPPKVVNYSIKKTYGRLLGMVESAFQREKPLFILGIYYPLAYYIGPDMEQQKRAFLENRQKQVVSLIRVQFLKRLESSAEAFQRSCETLLGKLLAWATKHSETEAEKRRLDTWKRRHADLIDYVSERQLELWGGDREEDADEDIVTEEMLEDVERLDRDEYKVEEVLSDTLQDLDEVADFLDELRKFTPQHDDKLKALTRLLKSDPVLREHKLLIFSEYADTARYLDRQLREAGIDGVEQIDSATRRNRSEVIQRFAPYYNESSSGKLAAAKKPEIRVLISTDILSEGLNLQDATRLINYDLHWNPVRLMQRIGRVDRRMNPDAEEQLLADHPDQKELRGKVAYWNFLPPDELEVLLRLYARVSHKALQISKTFGIEGRKLLKPEDDYDTLREFDHNYDGTKTLVEEMRLEYDGLLKAHPELASHLDSLPGRVFSGKEHPSPGAKAVFFCYRLPKPDHSAEAAEGELPWTEAAGETRWYLYNLADGKVLEEPTEIVGVIRCQPDTPRHCTIERKTLSDIRAEVEKRIKNTYLKQLQAPVGVKPILKAWMELS